MSTVYTKQPPHQISLDAAFAAYTGMSVEEATQLRVRQEAGFKQMWDAVNVCLAAEGEPAATEFELKNHNGPSDYPEFIAADIICARIDADEFYFDPGEV